MPLPQDRFSGPPVLNLIEYKQTRSAGGTGEASPYLEQLNDTATLTPERALHWACDYVAALALDKRLELTTKQLAEVKTLEFQALVLKDRTKADYRWDCYAESHKGDHRLLTKRLDSEMRFNIEEAIGVPLGRISRQPERIDIIFICKVSLKGSSQHQKLRLLQMLDAS